MAVTLSVFGNVFKYGCGVEFVGKFVYFPKQVVLVISLLFVLMRKLPLI